MEDLNENTRNLYIIKRRLAERKKFHGQDHWEYYVGDFIVKIFANRIQEHIDYGPNDSIVNHNILDVNLYELQRSSSGKVETYLDLERDSRFATYKPIKYSEYPGYSTGKEMPLVTLLELVKYLHRLSNLVIFS